MASCGQLAEVYVARRDEVLDAALELLDEVGLDALTVRRLAERLEVQPGALYRHYPSKAALLDAMVERLVATETIEGPSDADWDESVRRIAFGSRTAMLARRDGARLVTTFRKPGPSVMAGWHAFIGLLTEAGLSQDTAASAVDTVFAYVNGFTIEEQNRQADHPRAKRDRQFGAGLDLIINGIRIALTDARK
jgi:TetR/AcrR family tetracycline transcriptional repressor